TRGARATELGCKLVVEQEPRRRLRDLDRIGGIDEQAGLAVDDRVERAAHAPPEGRLAKRSGLYVDDPEPLAGEVAARQPARHRHQVRTAQPEVAQFVGDGTEEADRVD